MLENLNRSRKWIEKENKLKQRIEFFEDVLRNRSATLRNSEIETAIFELGMYKARLGYMQEIENIVSEIMRINGVRSKVRLCVSDKTNVELSLNGYNLNIKLFEDGNIRSLMVKDTLTTHIGHEMSHIVNGDVKYYTLGRAIVEGQCEYYKNRSDYPLSYRIVIALVVLYECRADLFGRKSAGLLGRKYSSDWILGDNTYKKNRLFTSFRP